MGHPGVWKLPLAAVSLPPQIPLSGGEVVGGGVVGGGVVGGGVVGGGVVGGGVVGLAVQDRPLAASVNPLLQEQV